MSTDHGAGELRAAWDDLTAALSRARDAVDSEELHAPPPSERGLAEGYRYLLGFTFAAIERAFFEDPGFPYFRRAIQPTDKATIDNADALYLSAAIDGDQTYRIRGRVLAQAPQYMIFETHTAYAGDSGSLMELSPAHRMITGSLDSSELRIESDGQFEILVGPQAPTGFTGNFLPSRRVTETGSGTAQYLIVRMLFHDWANEVCPDLHIEQIGQEGRHPRAIDAADAASRMRRAGSIVENQMKFWNEFYDVILEAHGDRNGDGATFMPRNGLNAPARANLATGGGQNTNVYSGGVFDLEPDEALLIETSVPVQPAYSGFHLSNLWGESLDYANHQSSLNGFQAEPDDDGIVRYVVAAGDPGVPNWLDTTGLRKGFLSFRWTYAQDPEQLPEISVSTVPLADVRSRMPATTRTVTPACRAAQIAIRQAHVQRRYRQY
ncbi:DUF1214 domain-containing protein [Mycobacterium crocinum]|uniref:DUF1214 domain-containing protein n=1 Tax=Mycolicibacterium crocinum TaxID=388459 RepID=A0ABY3TDQ0_9MYCO|nr:DUF1214 domain-containing protein [Mycolicibacterium crocinum]MCV7218651.1 DUF1214 domain-containing protein [Mycolicibacterium crocinum]ULN39203.1 DUF1214 domain-containing protein [Mycolicibacterium crocinum]